MKVLLAKELKYLELENMVKELDIAQITPDNAKLASTPLFYNFTELASNLQFLNLMTTNHGVKEIPYNFKQENSTVSMKVKTSKEKNGTTSISFSLDQKPPLIFKLLIDLD